MKIAPFSLFLVLLICIQTIQANEDAILEMLNGGKKECTHPPGLCGENFAPISKLSQNFTSSGCAAVGSNMINNEDDVAPTDRYLETCCDVWSACYQVCGSSKLFCDEKLSECMKEACVQRAPLVESEDCLHNVKTKGLRLQLSGCNPWYQTQKESCVCVEEASLAKERAGILFQLYKDFTSLDDTTIDTKVANFMSKITTAKQYGALLTKFVENYPEAITKVEQVSASKERNNIQIKDALGGDEL
mmetsp:Transcript_2494/g.3674  ORF Transcript_2494/g.3674 Transcript_2494/m.3674 type:complete len:246 (+) Transcript_2494:121-858(+)